MLKIKNKTSSQKPKILYLDTAYTLKMLTERGLEQEFLSRECGGYFEHVWGIHPFADVPEKRALKYEGFKFETVKFSDNQTCIEGLSVYYSFLKHFYSLNFLVSQIRFLRFLIALVRKEQIDIIMAVDPYYNGLIGLFLKVFTKAKLAIWVCANSDEVYKSTGVIAMPRLFKRRWVEKIIEKIVFKKADLVAGGNQNNLEFALNNGAQVNKSTVFPVGKLIHRQHVKKLEFRDKDVLFNSLKAKFIFIYVGRLIDIKFPNDVLYAFSEINKIEADSALILAGDGVLKGELEKISLELNIQDKVHFVGNVNQLRLANLLAGCFSVLSPLTGRSLIESALAGLPIVAYDRDWQLDFVEKTGGGIIVPFRNWKKMADKAVYLIQNPIEAKKYGAAARAAGLEICDLEKLYGHEKNEFNKLLKSR